MVSTFSNEQKDGSKHSACNLIWGDAYKKTTTQAEGTNIVQVYLTQPTIELFSKLNRYDSSKRCHWQLTSKSNTTVHHSNFSHHLLQNQILLNNLHTIRLF
jgi:hypothetical protein